MSEVLRYQHGISAIDAGYERPNLAAIHFLVEGDEAAVIDTGTNFSVPATLRALGDLGIARERVAYVILTHVHLDHAGGAGELMRRCPAARLVVHPRGARHVADPSKLWAATVGVYGEATAKRVYGEIVPVPGERIIEASDGSDLAFGDRTLLFRDTPGHARHQLAIIDSRSGHAFVGDTFGLSYRELDHAGRAFIIPTSSPTQFDPDALHRSIDLVAGYAPGAIYLTHFSRVEGIPRLVENLHRLIEAYRELADRHRNVRGSRQQSLVAGMREIVLAEARRQSLPQTEDRILEVLGLDVALNAQGLEAWIEASA